MKAANYKEIARHYDKNPARHQTLKEKLIQDILDSTKAKVRVLDLACGTGNFLKAQMEHYPQKRIEWQGADLSESMLSQAKTKLKGVELKIANAEDLPYEDEAFDFVSCNFAFHHFEGKIKALREIRRVLKGGGAFLMANICPAFMPTFWVYHFFPETVKLDRERFWTNKKLFTEFEKEGFLPELKTTVFEKRFSLERLLAEAENRDISQLNLIDAGAYKKGLKALKSWPEAAYPGTFATLRLAARKVK